MSILTKRKILDNATSNKKVCFDIIYEWEDILAKELNMNIIAESTAESVFDRLCGKIYKLIHIPLYRIFALFDKKRGSAVIMFDMSAKQRDGIYNNKRYIPCVIDYFLDDAGGGFSLPKSVFP